MARVIVGKCKKCGRDLRVKESGVRDYMRLTCKCGEINEIGLKTSQSKRPAQSRRPAYVLIMRRGPKPYDDSKYVRDVLKNTVPEALSTPNVTIKALWGTGSVDQIVAASRAAFEFGPNVLDPKRYDACTETFLDSESDGGIVVKIFHK